MENSHWLLFFFLNKSVFYKLHVHAIRSYLSIRALYSPIYLVSKYKMQCKYTLCMYRTARKQDSDIMFVYCQYKHSEMQLSCQPTVKTIFFEISRPTRPVFCSHFSYTQSFIRINIFAGLTSYLKTALTIAAMLIFLLMISNH